MTIKDFAEPMGGAHELADAWGCTCPNCAQHNGLMLRRFTDGTPFFLALCGCPYQAVRDARDRLVQEQKVVPIDTGRRSGAGTTLRLVAARPD